MKPTMRIGQGESRFPAFLIGMSDDNEHRLHEKLMVQIVDKACSELFAQGITLVKMSGTANVYVPVSEIIDLGKIGLFNPLSREKIKKMMKSFKKDPGSFKRFPMDQSARIRGFPVF